MSESRQCWICFGSEHEYEGFEEDAARFGLENVWLAPCQCKGSTQFVHQSCLLDWVNARIAQEQTSAVTPAVACPQCHYPYRVEERHLIPRPVMLLASGLGRWKNRLLLLSSVSCISTGIWLLAFAYGSATFCVAVGPRVAAAYFRQHGRPLVELARATVFGRDEPVAVVPALQGWVKLVVGMPLIPVTMLYSRLPFLPNPSMLMVPVLFSDADSLTLRWPPSPNLTALLLPMAVDGYRSVRDALFQRYLPPGWRRTRPAGLDDDDVLLAEEADALAAGDDADADDANEARMAIRVTEDSVISLLLFPTASAVLGWLLFRRSPMHPFHRTCLGGGLLMLATDLGRALCRYQAAYLQQSRRILNYQPVRSKVAVQK
jgi:hypothetical protein